MIENLLESIIKKITKQNAKMTIHSPKSVNIWRNCLTKYYTHGQVDVTEFYSSSKAIP